MDICFDDLTYDIEAFCSETHLEAWQCVPTKKHWERNLTLSRNLHRKLY